MIRFGPAGNSISFTEMGYKGSKDVPKYLKEMGLSAFEYQCGRGVKISEDSAKTLGEGLREVDVQVSLHAPYYISLSGTEEEKRLKSIDYILSSAKAVDWLGGTRIVVHSGSATKISREHATELAKDTVKRAQLALDEHGLSHINICPETMGKVGQLGTLEEVLELCSVDERIIPCIDFGHLNARTFGGIQTDADYKHILDEIENKLGGYRAKNFHVHFSKIEYTNPGGEKRHLTLADNEFGPEYEPLANLCVQRNLTPVIICESDGTQAEDAVYMKDYYNKISRKQVGL